MSRTLSRPLGSTGLGSASRAVPRFAAAPLRIQGGPRASSTSILSSFPLRGRALMSLSALGRSPSGDKTTDGPEDSSAGPAANGNSTFPVRIPPGTLKSGDLSIGNFLRFLRLEWKVADGAFVDTGCPYFAFGTDMKTAKFQIPIFAFIGGRWCATGAEIVGRVRTSTCCRGKPSAVFTMVGLTKPLADMGVEECEAVLLVVERDEDGRILGVGLMRVDPGAQGLENAAGPQPAAPEQVHEEAEEAPMAAGAADATADPSAATGTAEPSKKVPGPRTTITVGGNTDIKGSAIYADHAVDATMEGDLKVDSSTIYLLHSAPAAAPPPASAKKQGTQQKRQKANKAAVPAAGPLPDGGKEQGKRQKRQKANKAAMPVAAPEPEPAAMAKAVKAQAAKVSSKTPSCGNVYNITNNIGYLNQGNDLRENHFGVTAEGTSGQW